MKQGDVIVVIQVERFEDGYSAAIYADTTLMYRSVRVFTEAEALAKAVEWKKLCDEQGGETVKEQ